ncbi:hypothetical protein [Natronomonas sp.]|uniref:DUF7527 domain-containing protein n=1 Tax=Natronomonas sp. TaxID=2184060 RepID=UPI0039753FD1
MHPETDDIASDDRDEPTTDNAESAPGSAEDPEADAAGSSSAADAEAGTTADASQAPAPGSDTATASEAVSDADVQGTSAVDSEADSTSEQTTGGTSGSVRASAGPDDDDPASVSDGPSSGHASARSDDASDDASDPVEPDPPRDSTTRPNASSDTDVSSSATSRRESGDRSKPSNRRGRRGPGGIEAITTRTVPSLDPENSGRSDTASAGTESHRSTPSGRSRSADSQSASPSETIPPSSDRGDQLREEYESRIETYESRIEELETSVDDADARIEELEAEIDAIRAERDELQARLDAVDSVPGTRSMSSTEALAGTSLFVRETTRGEATLADAHDGNGDRETVESNLRIEYHTTFDDESVSVDGEPFESWLRSSVTYAFIEWLVMELLFEIRSTGSVEGLRPLYDALPGIDRIGFDETVAVGNGTEGREVTFDIVARGKKGNPLVVIEFDRRRDPTRAEAIEPFVTDASDVCEDYESLAGAVAITSSYFEADAMGAVEEATSTSLLSRSKHRSYVKLSRANGYHLCLVEARDGSFNLTVPEL